MTNIILNSKEEETSARNLLELMQEKSLDRQRGIALALNQEVVPKEEWPEKALSDGDQILIIKPTQGG